jgi:hypothetical protein
VKNYTNILLILLATWLLVLNVCIYKFETDSPDCLKTDISLKAYFTTQNICIISFYDQKASLSAIFEKLAKNYSQFSLPIWLISDAKEYDSISFQKLRFFPINKIFPNILVGYKIVFPFYSFW